MATRAGRVLAVALAILVLGAPAADAAVQPSRVTISTSVPLYHGKVRADGVKRCERHRKVTLWRKRPGPDQRIGRDRTNRRGRWRVPAPANLAPGDRFYAKVKAKVLSTVGSGASCGSDRSRTVTFVGE